MNPSDPTGTPTPSAFKNVKPGEGPLPASRLSLERNDEAQVCQLLSRGHHAVRVIKRALILRMSHQGLTGEQIAVHLSISLRTVYRTRQQYRQVGLTRALYDRPRSGRPSKASPSLIGQLLALYCRAPPVGSVRWTYDLLHQAGTVQFRWTISRASVHRYAHHHHLRPWQRRMWCIPQITPEYLQRMYDLLELYEQPYDPVRPVICFDEKSLQVQSHVIRPQQATHSHSYREDHQYEKRGTVNLFVLTEALTGTRLVQLTTHRTKKEFAYTVQFLLEHYSQAIEIHLVLDNLNTHHVQSLVEFLSPQLVQVCQEKVRWHYTPVHASWLNLAENEISILARQCLAQRFESYDHLVGAIQAWQNNRNQTAPVLTWLFSTEEARELFEHRPPDPLASALAHQDWTTLARLWTQQDQARQQRRQLKAEQQARRLHEQQAEQEARGSALDPAPPYRFADQAIEVTTVEDRVTAEQGPHARFLPKLTPRRKPRRYVSPKTALPPRLRVLGVLLATAPQPQSVQALCLAAQLCRQTVSKHLKHLQDIGHVQMRKGRLEQDGRLQRLYSPTPQASQSSPSSFRKPSHPPWDSEP